MTQFASKTLNGGSAESSEAELEPPSSSVEDTQPYSGPSLTHQLRGLFRRITGQKNDGSLKEALEEVIEEHEELADTPMDPEEKVMLHNMLSFSDIKVGDIMIPRTDIIAVPHDISLEDLKRHFIEERHTRVPIYKETLDTMKGFLHVKDMLPMLSGDKTYDINAVKRSLLFVPPSMRVMDLLVRMRHAGSHMAIVVDEYGGTDGLVTMEDVFEEIVGDIHDEHDDDDEEQVERIIHVNKNTVEVNARIPIETLEEELGLSLTSDEQSDEFDTLGGLVFFQLGRIPAKGESISHPSGARFEILDADMRRIRRARIHLA
ncbi:MAG: hemolysin family protein [Alphaproteobacteria bacterium]